jgi:hypothetical protein
LIKNFETFLRTSEANLVNDRHRAALRVCELIFGSIADGGTAYDTWPEIERLAFFAVGRDIEYKRIIKEREEMAQRLEWQYGLLKGERNAVFDSSRGPDHPDTLGQDSHPGHPEASPDPDTTREGTRCQTQAGVRDGAPREDETDRSPKEANDSENQADPRILQTETLAF